MYIKIRTMNSTKIHCTDFYFQLGVFSQPPDAAYNNFDYDLANRLLKVFGLNDRMKITNLSTGQRTASKLIVALAVNADYVLLDEPILGLDANHRDSFYKELVKTYQERPRTFVLSTHLIEEIQQLVEHVLIMDQHHIIINEDTEGLLAKAYTISGPEKWLMSILQA